MTIDRKAIVHGARTVTKFKDVIIVIPIKSVQITGSTLNIDEKINSK
jgi:hypothetical protein